MEQIADVGGRQLIDRPFRQFEAISQKMGIGTGGVLFHPRNAAVKGCTVYLLCRGSSDSPVLICIKRRLHKLPEFVPVQFGT